MPSPTYNNTTINARQDFVRLVTALGLRIKDTANHPAVYQEFEFEQTDNDWSD